MKWITFDNSWTSGNYIPLIQVDPAPALQFLNVYHGMYYQYSRGAALNGEFRWLGQFVEVP